MRIYLASRVFILPHDSTSCGHTRLSKYEVRVFSKSYITCITLSLVTEFLQNVSNFRCTKRNIILVTIIISSTYDLSAFLPHQHICWPPYSRGTIYYRHTVEFTQIHWISHNYEEHGSTPCAPIPEAPHSVLYT